MDEDLIKDLYNRFTKEGFRFGDLSGFKNALASDKELRKDIYNILIGEKYDFGGEDKFDYLVGASSSEANPVTGTLGPRRPGASTKVEEAPLTMPQRSPIMTPGEEPRVSQEIDTSNLVRQFPDLSLPQRQAEAGAPFNPAPQLTDNVTDPAVIEEQVQKNRNEQMGVGENIANNLIKGLSSVGEAVGTGSSELLNTLGLVSDAELGGAVSEMSQYRQDLEQKFPTAQYKDLESINSFEDFFKFATGAASQTAPQMGAFMVNPVLGAGVAFAQSNAGVYLDGVEQIARENNITPEEVISRGMDSKLIPAITAGISTGLETLASTALIKSLRNSVLGSGVSGARQATKTFLDRSKDVAKTAGREGLQESTQSAIEQTGGSLASGKGIGESIGNIDVGQVAMEGLAGSLIGGGSSTLANIAGSARENYESLNQPQNANQEGNIEQNTQQQREGNTTIVQQEGENRQQQAQEQREGNQAGSGDIVQPAAQEQGQQVAPSESNTDVESISTSNKGFIDRLGLNILYGKGTGGTSVEYQKDANTSLIQRPNDMQSVIIAAAPIIQNKFGLLKNINLKYPGSNLDKEAEKLLQNKDNDGARPTDNLNTNEAALSQYLYEYVTNTDKNKIKQDYPVISRIIESQINKLEGMDKSRIRSALDIYRNEYQGRASKTGIDAGQSAIASADVIGKGIEKKVSLSESIKNAKSAIEELRLRAKYHLTSNTALIEKAIKDAYKLAGVTNVMDVSQVAANENLIKKIRKIPRMFQASISAIENGTSDFDDNQILSEDGRIKNIAWVTEKLDNSTPENWQREYELAQRVMVAKRTPEYARIKRNEISKERYKKPYNELDLREQAEVDGIVASTKLTGISQREGVSDERVASEIIEAFEAMPKETQDRINEVIDRYRSIANDTLEMLRDNGIISVKDYFKIVMENDQYAALNRVMEYDPGVEKETVFPGEGAAGAGKKPGNIKNIKGSGRQIEDIFTNLFASYGIAKSISYENSINQQLVKLLQGDYANAGVKNPKKTKEDSSLIVPEKNQGPGTITVRIDGEKKYFRFKDPFTKRIFEEFGVTRGRVSDNKAIQMAADVASFARKSITNNPIFWIAQLSFDQMNAYIQGGMSPGIKRRRALESMAGLDYVSGYGKGYKESLKRVQAGGGMFFGKRAYTAKDLKAATVLTLRKQAIAKAREGDIVLHTKESLLEFWQNLEKVTATVESITRANIYNQTFKIMKQQGYSDEEARAEAEFITRDTLDFTRAGVTIKMLNRIAPFLNAAVQATDKVARDLADNPEIAIPKYMTAALMPVLMEKAYWFTKWPWEDDEEYERKILRYREQEQYLKDSHILIENPLGTGVIAIPFSQGPVSALRSLASRYIEANTFVSFGKDENGDAKIERFNSEAFENSTESILSTMPFQQYPTLGGNLGIGLAFGYDPFRGRQIIPESQEKMQVKARDNAYTSTGPIASDMARLFNDMVLGKDVENKSTGETVRVSEGNSKGVDPRQISFAASQFGPWYKWAEAGAANIWGEDFQKQKATLDKTLLSRFSKENPTLYAADMKYLERMAVPIRSISDGKTFIDDVMPKLRKWGAFIDLMPSKTKEEQLNKEKQLHMLYKAMKSVASLVAANEEKLLLAGETVSQKNQLKEKLTKNEFVNIFKKEDQKNKTLLENTSGMYNSFLERNPDIKSELDKYGEEQDSR